MIRQESVKEMLISELQTFDYYKSLGCFDDEGLEGSHQAGGHADPDHSPPDEQTLQGGRAGKPMRTVHQTEVQTQGWGPGAAMRPARGNQV